MPQGVPRRPKFDKERQAVFLAAFGEGIGIAAACKRAGISRHTFSRHFDKSEEFRQQMIEAEADINESVEVALLSRAREGDVNACKIWLYNRSGARWCETRNVKLSGDANAPIQIKVDLGALTDEELESYGALAAKLASLSSGEGQKKSA